MDDSFIVRVYHQKDGRMKGIIETAEGEYRKAFRSSEELCSIINKKMKEYRNTEAENKDNIIPLSKDQSH